MLPAFLTGGGLLAKLNTAAMIAFVLQTGKQVFDFFRNRGKGEETERINKENFNRSRNFADVNRRLRAGGSGRSVTTRDGALSFLGDPSRRLDDAPDIVEQNQSVLRGVETLGGFFPFLNTQTPALDNQKIIDSGFLGVRLEIDKINRNIDAIAAALAQSALFEEKYRKDMIDAMRRDLVEKGKDRSETRSERSIFNLITRPVEEVQTMVGNLANGLRNALLLSIGLETGAAFADAFGGDEGGDEDGDDKGSDDSTSGPKVGDYYRGRNRKYYILQSDGSFKKTNILPKSGRKFDREDFTPVVENIKENNTPPGSTSGTEGGENNNNIDGEKVSYNLNNSVEGGDVTVGDNLINSAETVAMNTGDLQGRDRFTYIDATTGNGKETAEVPGGEAGSQFDDSFVDSDVGRGSGYETFLTGSFV